MTMKGIARWHVGKMAREKLGGSGAEQEQGVVRAVKEVKGVSLHGGKAREGTGRSTGN